VFIKVDGEFKPLEEFMLDLYGAPRLNLTSANEHVPEIERKIRVIKERVRTVMYGMQFNAVPPIICISAVLFVTKLLNLFLVEGGILANYSPKQIMSGEVVHYKFCSLPFGAYCQISEEAQPRNSLAPRNQGALALGRSGNVQGGHKFYTLNTGMVVVRWDWKVLPMPLLVIDRIHSKAQGQPAQPIFADQHGKSISNFPPTFDDDPMATQTTNDELSGVMFPESEESAKITGVDGNQDFMDYMPEPDLDVGHNGNQDSMPEPVLDLGYNNVDFDSTPSDEMVDATNTDPVQVPKPPAVAAGLPKFTREHHKPTNYQPSMIGKRYLFATTQLGTTYLKDETYQHNPLVAFAFLQQLLVKAALKQ
jgi:hypothetical protein